MSFFGRGKRGEFERMAKPFVKSLYHAALRLTRQNEWAEDLTQDTLIRAYERFDLFQSGTNFRAWMFTILMHIYLNDCERGKRRPLTTSFDTCLEGSTWEFPAPPESDPAELLTSGLLDDQLQAALDALPEEFRLAVILVDIEDMAYQEAADALHIPIGTVRSRVSRGRAQMRRILTRKQQEQ